MKSLILAVFLVTSPVLLALTLDFTDYGRKLPSAYGFKVRGEETKLTVAGLENRSTSLNQASGLSAAQKSSDFSPDGAFELEIRFKLFQDALKQRQKGRFFLWDNKYNMVTDDPKGFKHCGFMVWLEKKSKDFKLSVQLGLEEKQSVTISMDKLNAGDGNTHTFLMKFDPSGYQTLYWDGVEMARIKTVAGKIGKARYPVVIGDRVASLYGPLGGVVHSVTIRQVKALKVTPLAFIQRKYGSRRVFTRREAKSRMTVEFSNMTDQKLSGKVCYSLPGGKIKGEFPFCVDAAGKGKLDFPTETNLMPGQYDMELVFFDDTGKEMGQGHIPYTVVPELTDFQPMLAGDYFFVGETMDLARNAGITHVHDILSAQKGKMTEHLGNRAVESLDLHLEHGLLCDDRTRITNAFVKEGKHLLIGRNGKPYPRKSVDAAEPEVYNYALSALKELVKVAGQHPAWDRIYTNNELRDAAQISFTENTRKRLKAATGLNIPKDASGRLPTVYSANRNVPWDCVVSTQSDEFRFWNWFWREGDGWDRLNGDQGAQTVKAVGRKRFLSDFGPATRALPYLGVAGDISLLSTWTYCNPDPMKLGQTTDELLALADGKKLIGIGNQGIWYRNQVAPPKQQVKTPPAWLTKYPEAKYISPHPDMLLEGFWIASMRKVEQFDTHGQGSWLRPTDHHSYRFTHPEVTSAYRIFRDTVRQPLGPALKHVDEVTPEVMILESFTNALYGGGHTWGWGNGWIADLHLALQWAHIQPGICYEDHLFRGDLDDGKIKVLFLPSLPVVSDRLLAKLKELQKKGVILAADENLNVALMPDFRFQSVIRDSADAQKSKEALQKLGRELREGLKEVLTPCMDSPSQDLILRRRASGEVQYLFAVNDCRKYGNYVGQWKRVMEEGVPLSAVYSVFLPAVAAYDLVHHRKEEFKNSNGKLEFKAVLGPGSGKIVALFPREIGMVQLAAPSVLKRGEDFSIQASIADKTGKRFQAVLPLEIKFESGSTVLPGSGFYATDSHGSFVLKDTVALNIPTGKAILSVRCLSSGIEKKQEIIIQ